MSDNKNINEWIFSHAHGRYKAQDVQEEPAQENAAINDFIRGQVQPIPRNVRMALEQREHEQQA